jgi:hypothetical protein
MRRSNIMIASFTFGLMIAVSTGAPTPEPLPDLRPGSAPEPGNASQVSVNLYTELKAGWQLNRGESLFSPLGGFRLTMQGDGNLLLYHIEDDRIPADVAPLLLHTEVSPDLYIHPLWSTGTNVPTKVAGTGAYCVMNDAGNFVVFDEDDKPCFQSGTKGHPGAFLRCQDDGNLVVYTRDKKAIWQSKTYSRFVEK